MTDETGDLRPTSGVVLVTAALVLAGFGIVLVVVGAATDSKGVLIVAAAAIAAALVPILWWPVLLIQEWHGTHTANGRPEKKGDAQP